DQNALEFKRADPIIRSFEYIVSPAHVGEEAIFVAGGDIAGVIVAVAQRCGILRLAAAADHQAERSGGELETEFAFVRRAADQLDPVTRHGSSHGTQFYYLTRRVPNHRCRLRLAVAVANSESPGLFYPRENLGIERLSRAHRLAESYRITGE